MARLYIFEHGPRNDFVERVEGGKGQLQKIYKYTKYTLCGVWGGASADKRFGAF